MSGFYVDNGPFLPLRNRLPHINYWLLPTIVGVPLIWRASPVHQDYLQRSPRPSIRHGTGSLREGEQVGPRLGRAQSGETRPQAQRKPAAEQRKHG